jgi:hypothetical protein
MKAPQLKSTAFELGSDRSRREAGHEWVRPAVTRLAAGSAEDGNNTQPDGGQPS